MFSSDSFAKIQPRIRSLTLNLLVKAPYNSVIPDLEPFPESASSGTNTEVQRAIHVSVELRNGEVTIQTSKGC